MRKSRLVLCLLFLLTLVQAQVNNLQELTDSLLSGNATYQQAVSRYEQEKANLSIQNSLSWFDINFQYRQYDNDYTRLESGDEIEDADVEEKDKRWGIELSKQIFPKDFDNVTDAVGTRINLLRYRQELKLAYYRAAEEIWEELALWQEADAQSRVLQSRLQILYQQNQTLEELYGKNDLDPELLILNLEEIEDKEKDYFEYRELADFYIVKYGDILPQVQAAVSAYLAEHNHPDTLGFRAVIKHEKQLLAKETGKLSGKIRRRYLSFYLPQIELSLAYFKRENRQTWNVNKEGELSSFNRDQDEEYPQGELEISLPLNLYSNLSGKHALLKGYERELRFRSRELNDAWEEFASQRINRYQAAANNHRRKSRLLELYTTNLEQQNLKYREEPSLLGKNPELKLQKEMLKLQEAQAEKEAAEIRLAGEIFLLNSLNGAEQ